MKKLYENIGEILKYRRIQDQEETLTENESLTDLANIIAIQPKNAHISKWLTTNFDGMRKDLTKLKEIQRTKSRFSIELLKKAIDILDQDRTETPSITITMGKNTPITLENDQLRIIIAPRKGEDEE